MNKIPSGVKILVVDDDPTLRELLIDTLNSIGYDSDSAIDGIDALEKLERFKYNLMISDIKMPNIDGIALLKKVRRYYPDMPVLFITGVASPELIGRASPDGFLAKPFRISHMEQLIKEALDGKTERVKGPIKKVMVVDDDDLFRSMLTETLSYNDFIPTAVEGGEEALRELENGMVDAVIADIKMPGMNGVALMKHIKEKYPELPVILITGFLLDEHLAEISKADNFLRKPFNPDKIIELLKELTPLPNLSND